MEPITLVTGTPGAGKTLWVISSVEAERKARGLPVFYAGIPEVTLPWTEIKAEEWHKVDGPAIVVIDEVHRVFPARPPGSRPPEHVAPFDQLRHQGLEAVLLTQHPNEMDHYIRRRVGRHVHLNRVFARPYARTKEWQKLGDPEDYHSCKEAMSGTFRYPTEFYSAYESAHAHTMQPRMPWKELGWRLAIPVLVVAIAAGLFLRNLFRAESPTTDVVTAAPAISHSATGAISESAAAAISWSSAFNERVPGVPYSAPFYDGAIRPVTFPKISGCIEIRNDIRTRCYCETQQGTRITSISTAQCQYWLRNGWFDFSRPDDGEGTSQSSASSASFSEDGGRAAEVPTAPAAAAIPPSAHS